MKKILIALFAILLCTFSTMANATTESGSINVQQSDFIEIDPNIAEMEISIETSDKDLNKATADNKAKAQNVYKSLSSVLDDGDYLKTGNYVITPKYVNTDGKKVFDSYQVINTISLKTANLVNVAKILDTAVEQGANRINNLKLSVSNYDEVGNELLTNLTKKALTQANAIAKASNSTILGIKSIDANLSTDDNRPRYYAMSLAKDSSSINSSSTPFVKGKIKIYGTVNASFFVKQ